MVKMLGMGLLCIASAMSAHAETFVIEAGKAGHEATIKIPVSAVTQLSANSCESLDGYGGLEVEAMRLSGDVLISIAGSEQPIQIKADKVVLELTPDSSPNDRKPNRAELAQVKVLRSSKTWAGDEGSQIFVGNVVFNLQTTSGPMEIKADRVEHQLRTEAGV